MESTEDPFDKKINDLPCNHRIQIQKFYQGFGNYYTELEKSLAARISNWAFTLNTGGLAGFITFIGVTKQSDTPFKFIYYIIFIMFVVGILFIITSVFLEKKRFEISGAQLEESWKSFNEGRITAKKFMDNVPNPWFSCWVDYLEISSYIFFLLGLLFSAMSFIC